jgi:hypothetical protein
MSRHTSYYQYYISTSFSYYFHHFLKFFVFASSFSFSQQLSGRAAPARQFIIDASGLQEKGKRALVAINFRRLTSLANVRKNKVHFKWM